MEAVIALVVVALGLLAMAGLQARNLTEVRNGAARLVASQLATDLLDRMRFNATAPLPAGTAGPYETGWGTPAPPPADCLTVPCTAQQMAAYDLSQWKASLGQQLPEGDARIFRSTTDPNQFGVLFRWKRMVAARESAASAAQQQLFAAADEIRDALGGSGTGVAGIECTSGYTCHLTYLRP